MLKELVLIENTWHYYNNNDPKPLVKKVMKDAKLVSQKKKKGTILFTFEFDDALESDFVKSLTKTTKKVKQSKNPKTEQIEDFEQAESPIKVRSSKVKGGTNKFNPAEYENVGLKEAQEDKKYWKKHNPVPRARPTAKIIEAVCIRCQRKEKVSSSLINIRNVEGGMDYLCNRCCARK